MSHPNTALWPSELKRTRTRKAVWDELHAQSFPISAGQLYKNLREKGSTIDLSTIYRILERFTELSVVVQSKSADKTTVLYGLNIHRHTHFAVCVQCHTMEPIDQCPLSRLSPLVDTAGFHAPGHHLEGFGYCPSCFQAKSKEAPNQNP